MACDTYFGQQSILALCSLNARCDDVLAEHSMQNIPQGSNIQMLHMGGCKGTQVISYVISVQLSYILSILHSHIFIQVDMIWHVKYAPH